MESDSSTWLNTSVGEAMKDKAVFNKAAQCPSVGHASENFTLLLPKHR